MSTFKLKIVRVEAGKRAPPTPYGFCSASEASALAKVAEGFEGLFLKAPWDYGPWTQTRWWVCVDDTPETNEYGEVCP